MSKGISQGIVVALLVVVLAMHGTATKLVNKRNIKLQGAISGNADFDGSKNVTINTEATVSKVTKTLTSDGITADVVLRKQFNIVYANLKFTIPKNTVKVTSFQSVFPSGYEPKENLMLTSQDDFTGETNLKLIIRPTNMVAVAKNASTDGDAILIAQATYIVD